MTDRFDKLNPTHFNKLAGDPRSQLPPHIVHRAQAAVNALKKADSPTRRAIAEREAEAVKVAIEKHAGEKAAEAMFGVAHRHPRKMFDRNGGQK